MKLFYGFLIYVFFTSVNIFAGTSDLTISVDPEIEVCNGIKQSTLTLINNSGLTYTNLIFNIGLPSGIIYELGSLDEITTYNVSELDISDNSELLFTSNDLIDGDSIKFIIYYSANMDAISFQNSGGVFRNDIIFISDEEYLNEESDGYNILYPVMSILSVSPTSQTFVSGSSITRTINVINGGNGKTSELYITDVPNSVILTLDGVDIGIISGDTIILSGSDFNGIGNGDNYFDQYESITVTETLSGTSCSDITVTSSINVHWYCESSSISTSTSYANATIDFQSPSLKLAASESLDACFGGGVASPQELAIINSGNGIASTVDVQIYKSIGGSYNEAIFSRFDESSFQYKLGVNGGLSSIPGLSSTSTTSSGDYACLGASPIGKVEFTLDEISPSDTIYVVWDMYSCCIQTCENDDVKGWKAEVDYTDVCGSTAYTKSLVGQDDNAQDITFFTETPTDIHDGESQDYTFIVSSFTNTLPVGDGASYVAKFTLDDDLLYEDIKFHSNGIEWTPTSVTYDAGSNIVTAIYPEDAPFTVAKSVIDIILKGVCGDAGWKNIQLDFSYVPDTSCTTGCEIPLDCEVIVSTYLHCPMPSCEGLNVLSFDIERTNFGSPDNNLDGAADGSGSLDMTEVKDNRAMTGDTIQTSMVSVIETTTDTWQYAKFTSSVDYGDVLSFINADLTIYDASTSTSHTVTGLVATTSSIGYEKDFIFDLSVSNISTLNGALVGYEYAQGDSISLDVNYYVFNSVVGLIQETTFLNEFYLSDFASPSTAQKENCNFKNGRITLIGYSWRNNSPNNLTVKTCTKTIYQYFGMSIGDESSNYAGGNLFPYEFRQWGNVKDAKVVIPPNYSHVSTTIKFYRTRKTNSTIAETVSSISPDITSGDTLYYDLEQFFTSGQATKGDDGFYGKISVEIAPNCDVPENTYENVDWTFNYQKSEAIDGAESGYVSASSPDKIRFKRSSFNLSSTNPWQDANTRSVSWDYKIQNTSSSGADNTWIHIVAPANIVIDSIYNDNTSTKLTQQSDLYLVGTINASATGDFTIYGTFSNCDTVLISTYAGYECTGYPDDFASFSCSYEFLPLYVEPKPSAYQTRISAALMEDPCSPQIELTVDITSVKIAHMYDMTIDFTTSDTSSIKVVDGTSEFLYNASSTYESISDPDYSSDTYSYDINDYESSFATDGIPGVLDLSNNNYKLKTILELGDQFEIGDFLQVQIDGQNACDVDLATINLAYDPNSKFEKDNTAGLHLDNSETWSGAWGDYDNDGFDDLFVPTNDISIGNLLYHNEGDGTFTKVTTGAIVTDLGSSITGSWGDYDNDGDLDLFVTNNADSKNKLYHNNGDGSFTSMTDSPIVEEGIYSHSAAWGDYNKDGHLDLVVSDFHSTHFNFLFRGDGAGSFVVDDASVISQSASSAVGISWADYDNDGDLDLFIANTNNENNQLFRNDVGVFVEITTGDIVTDGGTSVGGVWGDYDNDGDLDLFVTNSSDIEANMFYENDGDGTFTKITSGAVVSDLSNSHGATWIDYDNDGDLDLIVANNQDNNNNLYANNGDKTFTSVTNAITEETSNSYGTAWSDFDNDGDYDLFVANINNEANDFFINEKGSCTNHIRVKLVGCNSNKAGIGAVIKVKATIGGASIWQTKHISTQTSAMGGQNSIKLLFGLGDATSIDSLIVIWPSGVLTYMVAPAINQLHTINEDCGSKVCGTVFYDTNSNGVQDSGEMGIPNSKLEVSPGGHFVYTDDNGYYQFYIADGTYVVSQLLDGDLGQVYPVLDGDYAVVVNAAASAEYCGNDFGNTSSCMDPDLSLNLGTTAFRRGLTNMLNVVVINSGAFEATGDITIELALTDNTVIIDDDWTSISTATGYNAYSFTFSGLGALSDTVFELTDSVTLSSSLEETVSVSSEISYTSDECDLTNNSFSMTDIVVGSIDPNDKMVVVKGKGLKYSAIRTDTLIFKIRFQNIGTYAARRVFIEDQLSEYLDWNTFTPLSSSHPFSVSLVDGKATWINNNIELPDSSSDILASEGYVSFSIQPLADCPPFQEVNNIASIQFDYNEFINTNRTSTVIEPYDSGIYYDVFIYPNPTSSDFEVILLKNKKTVLFDEVKIFAMSGELISLYRYNILQDRVKLSSTNIENGIYIIQVTSENNELYNSRVIIAK